MSWHTGRLLVAIIVLGALGLGGHRGAGVTRGGAAVCETPVVIGPPARLVCDPVVLPVVAAVCPPDGQVRVGDRVDLVAKPTGCGAVARPLRPGHRLRLGVALDVDREPAAGLMRVSGIGRRTADRIVDGRPWGAVERLSEIKGVGPRRLAAWRGALRASPPPLLWPSSPRPAASSPRRP